MVNIPIIKSKENPKKKRYMNEELYYRLQDFLDTRDAEVKEEPNKEVISKHMFETLMREFYENEDTEKAHMAADALMVCTLQALGYNLEEFLNHCKYYV